LVILKKRLREFFSNLYNVPEYRIKITLNKFSPKFWTAHFIAAFSSRRLALKYNIYEFIRPIIKQVQKFISGLFIVCYGRYRRRARVAETAILKGTMPFSTISEWVDYSKKTVKTRFGIANFKIWVHYSHRTFSDSMRHYKKKNYLFILPNTKVNKKIILRFYSTNTLLKYKKYFIKKTEIKKNIKLKNKQTIVKHKKIGKSNPLIIEKFLKYSILKKKKNI